MKAHIVKSVRVTHTQKKTLIGNIAIIVLFSTFADNSMK